MGARVLPSPPPPARLVSLKEKEGASGVGGAHSFHAPVAVCRLTSGSGLVGGLIDQRRMGELEDGQQLRR